MTNSQRNLIPNQENKNIEILIHEIRGKQVILDFDLAKLYQCANGTKAINLAVKRHPNRFPERYMFQLTKEEYQHLRFQIEAVNSMSSRFQSETLNPENLRFQIETSSLDEYGGRRYLPYAFTEQGVAMLATILRTAVAEQVSIQIMDAFVAMRHYLADNDIPKSLNNINNKLVEHDEKLDFLFSKFDKKEQLFDRLSYWSFDKSRRRKNLLNQPTRR